MISYILLLFLLCCSFFFSGTETALTTVSQPLLYEKEKQGNYRAKLINQLKQNSAQLISTLLFGNNVVNIAITALATALLIEAVGDEYGVIIATFGVSFVVLIFSEILPKTYALNNPLSFSLIVAPLVNVSVIIFKPFVNGLNWISMQTMRLLPKSHKEISADDIKAEIRGAIDLKTKTIPQEQGMLKSVLDLADVTVENIMIHRSKLVSLNATLPIKSIFDFIARSPFSRIPLWKGKRDNIVGILHSKAVLKAMNAYFSGNKNLNLSDYCTKPWFVLNTTSLLDQLHAFKRRREHFALVVDEYGALQGVVTLEDVLEEIVGDISDETDRPEQSTLQVIKTDTGAYRLDGSTTLRDLNRHFNWDIPDDNAATLAGFIMYETERIPNIGQTFVLHGFTFTIIEKQGNRIAMIEVIPPAI